MSIDKFNIIQSGSLADDLQNVENNLIIKTTQVPNIEVKEVVIKESGNFLNIEDNIINIPLEMIVFPFFTPQKQNKKVNFQYTFQDLGVTMNSTLIAKDQNDKVFQPSIFEEKMYTYFIMMYENKRKNNNRDDFIEFEISDFIVNFLGNKMNRTYYTKVEQALKNMKNTEYQFTISNHTKLGKNRFEDNEFKLLTYQKLEHGRKKYYRVRLNKNILYKIDGKRYIKYNSRELLRILAKDPIAGRIYKYICKIRFNENRGHLSIRTLAAIVPLKTEQITERVNKKGKKKEYVLSRLKQVNIRICKAFDNLVDLGYILKYSNTFAKKDNTYYIDYEFNSEKDGDCHISQHTLKIKEENSKNIIEGEIISENTTFIPHKKERQLEFSYKIMDAIEKARKNFRINKVWNKNVDNKINKIIVENGEKMALEVLRILYNTNAEIGRTLVQYINGILKNINKGATGKNLTLFGDNAGKTKNQINKRRKPLKKKIKSNGGEIKNTMEDFLKLDEMKKLSIEQKALELYTEETGNNEKNLIECKYKYPSDYYAVLEKYIFRVWR